MISVCIVFLFIRLCQPLQYAGDQMLCWITPTEISDPINIDCPDNINLYWINRLPEEMVESVKYHASYVLEINNYPVYQNICTHGNLHACIHDIFCNPAEKNPALVTSTPAVQNTKYTNNTCNFTSSFDALELKPGNWTIIAHVEFFINKSAKFCTAIGTTRIMNKQMANSIIEMLPWLIPVIVIPSVTITTLVVLCLFFRHKRKHVAYGSLIPESLHFFFDRSSVEKRFEIHNENPVVYKLKLTDESSPEYRLLIELMEKLDFGPIRFKDAYAVVSPTLVQNFSNHRSIIISRLEGGEGGIHYSQDWKKLNEPELHKNLREFYIQELEKKILKYPWNKGNSDFKKAPIIAVVHGTDLSSAWKIVCGGFVSLLKTDKGFYGQGLYFSSSAQYIVPYFSKSKPAIIISLVLPGNSYPVIEPPLTDSIMIGAPIGTGYQSHYVVTSKNGFPVLNREKHPVFYDEIVIGQESQVVPLYVLSLKFSSIESLIAEFNRETELRESRQDIRESRQEIRESRQQQETRSSNRDVVVNVSDDDE